MRGRLLIRGKNQKEHTSEKCHCYEVSESVTLPKSAQCLLAALSHQLATQATRKWQKLNAIKTLTFAFARQILKTFLIKEGFLLKMLLSLLHSIEKKTYIQM